MNVLDENILESQRQLLRSWRVPIRQIGIELAHKGMQDEDLIPFLLTLRRPTLFTRDLGFYAQSFCHARCCLGVLAIEQHEVAHFVRRLLRHAKLDTQAKRMGKVIRVMHTGLALWSLNSQEELRLPWSLK